MITHAAALLASLPLHGLATADDPAWPQWDGPDRTGTSSETAWASSGAEEDLWRTDVGLGYSTVVVANGALVTMGYDKERGLDRIFCFDPLTGDERWRHAYPCAIWDRAHEGGTVNTPAIDGDVVYALNREGNLFCLELESGEVRWHVMLKPEENPHGLEYPTWGFSGSPLLVGDDMYLNCGKVLSIDKASGKVLWASKDYGHGYGTPTAFEHEGQPVLAVVNGEGVAIVAREDGAEVAFLEMKGKSRGIHVATPVDLGDSLFVAAGTVPTCARVRLVEGKLEPVWQNREMVNMLSGCVRVGEHLYGFDGAVLKCIDLDGKEAWAERGIGNGAVLAAGERLLVMGGTGELIVCAATPEGYEPLAKSEVFDDGAKYWTKPILVGGIVYCRSSRGGLVARDHRGL